MAFVGILSKNKITLWAASYSACMVYTKTIIHLSVDESLRRSVNIHHYSPPFRWIIVNYWSVWIKVKSDHRSKFSNLSNWKEEARKNSGLQRDSNPWPPRYRCDALPTELYSHTLETWSIYWVQIFPCSEMMWSLYEIIHICTAVVDEGEEWSSQ